MADYCADCNCTVERFSSPPHFPASTRAVASRVNVRKETAVGALSLSLSLSLSLIYLSIYLPNYDNYDI